MTDENEDADSSLSEVENRVLQDRLYLSIPATVTWDNPTVLVLRHSLFLPSWIFWLARSAVRPENHVLFIWGAGAYSTLVDR